MGAEKVKIVLTNLMGEMLEVIADQTFSIGIHTFKYNVTDISSGCYLLTIETGKFTENHKLLIMK